MDPKLSSLWNKITDIWFSICGFRCLEEGAEDFLLKPVKLADVKRLRDSLLKAEERVFKNIMHKRELEANDIFSQLKRAKIWVFLFIFHDMIFKKLLYKKAQNDSHTLKHVLILSAYVFGTFTAFLLIEPVRTDEGFSLIK